MEDSQAQKFFDRSSYLDVIDAVWATTGGPNATDKYTLMMAATFTNSDYWQRKTMLTDLGKYRHRLGGRVLSIEKVGISTTPGSKTPNRSTRNLE